MVYRTNNRGNVFSAVGLEGTPAQRDTWFPREDLDQEHADHLSRLVDKDDWCLNDDVYASCVLGKSVLRQAPTIVIFAI